MGKVIAIIERVYRTEIEVEIDRPQDEIDAIEEDTTESNNLSVEVYSAIHKGRLMDNIDWNNIPPWQEVMCGIITTDESKGLWLNYDY